MARKRGQNIAPQIRATIFLYQFRSIILLARDFCKNIALNQCLQPLLLFVSSFLRATQQALLMKTSFRATERKTDGFWILVLQLSST